MEKPPNVIPDLSGARKLQIPHRCSFSGKFTPPTEDSSVQTRTSKATDHSQDKVVQLNQINGISLILTTLLKQTQEYMGEGKDILP